MIRKAKTTDLDAIDALSQAVIEDMHSNAIFQWNQTYPRKAHFKTDITHDALYVFEENQEILGVMAFYEENETVYKDIEWLRRHSMVIHRILVMPHHQKKHIGSSFMRFAIEYAHKHGYESIKIDTYPANYKMRSFLKKHNFIELDYLKQIHRIAFERIIEIGKMHKIMVLGSSGTGKTTLARLLSKKLHIPHLPLDTVYWQKDWASLSKPEFARIIRNYLKKHDRYVIEGNYTNSVTFMERLHHADTIILLDYPVHNAIKGIFEREKRYKHRYRSDMAEGCIEEVDQEFLQYVYNFKQKTRKMLAVINQYKGRKNILTFQSRATLMRWLDTI